MNWHWLLADAIDKWNTNGQRTIDFIRQVGFPLVVAVIATLAYARTKSFAAVMVVVMLGAVAWVPIMRPEVLGTISDMIF